MKISKSVFWVLLCLFGFVLHQKNGTPAEAKELVKKVIEFYKTNGKKKTFTEINNPKGKFVYGDLYIFVYDLKGKCVAHGGMPSMIGKDLSELKDADGKPFVKERLEIIKSKGSGWQNYKWTNPVDKAIEEKTAYIEKYDNLIFGCGAYRK